MRVNEYRSNVPGGMEGGGPSRQPKRHAAGLVVVLSLLLAGAVSAAWIHSGDYRPAAAGLGTGDLTADAERLWTWADAELSGGSIGASWSARWDAALDPAHAAALASELRLAEAGPRMLREERLYRFVLWLDDGGTAQALLDGSGAEQSLPDDGEGEPIRAVLLLDSKPGLGQAEWTALLADAAAALEGSDIASASLSFRGAAEAGRAVDRIAQAAGAKETERYEDGGTTSVAYYTDKLSVSPVTAGAGSVNLQLAARYDSLSRNWQIAGGVPLITGDYAADPDSW